jgi:hypothetical protein
MSSSAAPTSASKNEVTARMAPSSDLPCFVARGPCPQLNKVHGRGGRYAEGVRYLGRRRSRRPTGSPRSSHSVCRSGPTPISACSASVSTAAAVCCSVNCGSPRSADRPPFVGHATIVTRCTSQLFLRCELIGRLTPPARWSVTMQTKQRAGGVSPPMT